MPKIPQVPFTISRPTIGFDRHSEAELRAMLADAEATIAGTASGSADALRALSLEYYVDLAAELRLELSDRAARGAAR